MKILHAVASMDPTLGGVCQAVRNAIPPLTQRDCHCDVVSLDAPTADFGLTDPFTVFKSGPGIGPWGYSKTLLPWAMQNFANYDSVIIHGLWQYHSYAATKAIRLLKRQDAPNVPRTFAFSHGMLDPWFQRDPSRRLKAIRNYWYWKAIEHRSINQADGVLFTCQRELELAHEPFRPYHPKQELNVGMGVKSPPPLNSSMPEAFRASCPDLNGKPYLLFLSRLHPKKGVDLLLRAYDKLARNSPRPLPALVIAGPIDGAYAKQMKGLATALELPDVFFPGMLSGDSKWGAFYGCEAFVLPSHQENFGIAVVEALACGKPVLISNQVNIFSDIESDGAAFADSDTPEGTEALLREWLSTSEESRRAMSSQALECYQKRYLPAAAAEKFLEAIGNE